MTQVTPHGQDRHHEERQVREGSQRIRDEVAEVPSESSSFVALVPRMGVHLNGSSRIRGEQRQGTAGK
jgi:hypothetical protein